MAFCSKCGAQLNEEATICPSCGTPVGYETEEAANPTQPVPTGLLPLRSMPLLMP